MVALDTVATYICLKAIHESLTSCLLIFPNKIFLLFPFFFFSSGKDTMVKWWDLDTQHCFKTMVGHRTEVHVGSCARERMARQKDGFLPWAFHGPLFLLLAIIISCLERQSG